MIEIIVTACMINDLRHCQEEHLSFMAESVTPQQCMKNGQAELVKWAERHPKWHITRWSCGPRRAKA